MNICFVYPDIEGTEYYGTRKFYHGIGYLSSLLKREGHSTSLIYLQDEMSGSDFLAKLAESKPRLVAFSSTTNQFPFVKKYAAFVKQEMPETKVICGGAHATLAPQETIADENIDMLCIGEGEYALLELAQALEHGNEVTDVRNLWAKANGDIVKNQSRPLIQDLDELPFADRELFNFGDILKSNGGWVDMMAGRGCPYECSYCCNPALKSTFRGLGKYVRYRTVENILAEIRQLRMNYEVKIVNFQDDVFTLDRHWTLVFCDAYSQSFKLPFWINTRVERIVEEPVVRALAMAGCKGVRIGLESGNETLRQEILNRKISDDMIIRAFGLLKKYGLESYTCNMIGIPGETPEMIQQTIDLNRRLAPTSLQFSVFYPYPMTRLHEISVEKGYYSEGYISSYYSSKSLLRMPQLSQEDIQRGYDRFVELQQELKHRGRRPLMHRVHNLARFLYRKVRGILRPRGTFSMNETTKG